MFKLALTTLIALAVGINASAPLPPIMPPTMILPLAGPPGTEVCLDVRGGILANETPVQLLKCNGTPGQSWVLHNGPTTIQVNGTNFCLDAGSAPANGVGMKISECVDNLPAQQWNATTDFIISLLGTGFCLDDPNGKQTDGTQVRIKECLQRILTNFGPPSTISCSTDPH